MNHLGLCKKKVLIDRCLNNIHANLTAADVDYWREAMYEVGHVTGYRYLALSNICQENVNLHWVKTSNY